MGLKKTRKVPAGPKEVPTGGKRFATSSRKAPKPTGMNPSSPGYGTMTSGGQKDPVARAARVTGTTTSRNIPTGQELLTSKVKRQAY